ncbi:MAG: hypothetical protein ACFE0O_13655 [Opitutales bacterium]
MEWNIYLVVLFLLGMAFFGTAVAALTWSARKGHFRHFDEQSRSIFTEEEPEGVQTDQFPDKTRSAIQARSDSDR